METLMSATLEINANASNFEYVVDHSSIELGYIFEPVTIDSNIPVTVLQYRESFKPARLFPSDTMKVYIKKKCTNEAFERNEPSGSNIDMSNNKLTIRMPKSSDGVLVPSTYKGEWVIANQNSDKCDGIISDGCRIVKNAIKKISASLTTPVSNSSSKINEENMLSECTEVAEILYDPCHVELNITAPSLQLFDNHEIKGLAMNDNGCQTENTATLKYSDEPNLIDSKSSKPYIVQYYDFDLCYEESYGRPFIDEHGNSVMAQAIETEDLLPQWSNFEQNSGVIDQAKGTEWIDRAIGEHASIASFAAFTIQLMTNNAPPDLIADSLQAAMDEFRHARTSFDMASFFLQKNVSPGQLPATSLSFEQNLSHLAFGVAKEGCVDETVSALLAASEVMMFDLHKIDKPGSWKDKVTVITKEEANHSALAWRTIFWACNEDRALCDRIINYMLTEGQAYARKRIQTSGLDLDINIIAIVENEWMVITRTLVSLLESPYNQENMDLIHQSREKNFVNEIGDIIINNVLNATKKTIFSS